MIAEKKVYRKKDFTPEQKEQYKQKKEAEKEALYSLYQKFLEKKTIADFIGIIANYKTMHKYTLRNRFLVLAQAEDRNDDKFVGILNSFVNWQKQDIKILKGSKAYKVLVPIFKKVKSLQDDNQESEKEEQDTKKILSHFKLGNVFDISQTNEHENYLKEQKEIDRVIMKNAEIGYNTALGFVKSKFPEVSIKEDFKNQSTKGSYDPISKQITLYEKSSHTIFHEIGRFVTKEILKVTGDLKKQYSKNEILAELFSYLLMKRFDKQIDYNFAYSNIWSSRVTDEFEMHEFEQCVIKITKFLDKIIIPKN